MYLPLTKKYPRKEKLKILFKIGGTCEAQLVFKKLSLV